MRLIFIRHGDPDYANDNLTEKGKREALLLSERVSKWENIAKIYTSPLGRAKATAEPCLKKLGLTAEVCPWLQEFYYNTKYPENLSENFRDNITGEKLAGKDTMCWDLLPDFYTSDKAFFDKDQWADSDFMKGGNIKSFYKTVCDGLDGLLEKEGYIRNEKGFYNVLNPVENPAWTKKKYQLDSLKSDYPEEKNLVFFCHLGVMFTMIAYLTGLSPMQLWQGFYVAPTSITVLNSEERVKGQAFFRVERLGDTNHLINGNEPVSSSGYFADVLREKI